MEGHVLQILPRPKRLVMTISVGGDGLRAVGAVIVMLFLFVTGCSSSSNSSPPASSNSSPAKSAGRITATPNPVPPGQGFGTATIGWDTGDGAPGQVYVAVGDSAEKLFADDQARGSLDAPWIGAGATYEFRLYAGKEHKNLLASVKVIRSEQ